MPTIFQNMIPKNTVTHYLPPSGFQADRPTSPPPVVPPPVVPPPNGLVTNAAERPTTPPTTPPVTPPPTTPATTTTGSPRNLADPANAPWLRQVLQYNPGGLGQQPGLYDGGNPAGLWDDMEEIDNTHASWAHGVNERTYNQDNGEGTTVRNVRYIPKVGSFLNRLNHEYGGVLSQGFQGEPGNEGGGAGGQAHRIDFSKLPQTRFGSPENVIPVNDLMMDKLINPDMVYDDPVYGKITHRSNHRSGNEWVGQALMAAGSLGMGAIMAPAAAGAGMFSSGRAGLGLVNAARGLANGSYGGALSLAGTALGLPSYVAPIANTAISLLTNNNNNGGRP
jgi:hypothetical protein